MDDKLMRKMQAIIDGTPPEIAEWVPGSGPIFPEIYVPLVGMDGNAFAILGRVDMALKKYGASEEVRDAFQDEATAGDYNHLLQTVLKYVNTTAIIEICTNCQETLDDCDCGWEDFEMEAHNESS